MLKTNSPWEKLNPDDAKRVSIKGRFDFFWVVLEDSLPALMLKLPVLPDPIPKLPKLKNIDVVLLTDSMAVISSTDTFESKSLSENNGYATTDTSTCSSFKISPSTAFSYYKSSDSSLNSESTSSSLDHNLSLIHI